MSAGNVLMIERPQRVTAPDQAPPGPERAGPEVWTDARAGTCARLEVIDGVCVVSIDGELDAAALQPCRAALDAALCLHPTRVIVDLAHSGPPNPVSVALLSAARRYARARGAALTLAGVPAALMAALRQAHVSSLYEVEATSSEAVAHAAGLVPPGP